MRFLLFLCLVFVCCGRTVAGTSPLKSLQYITTDYRGVISNGHSILCYGTHGIIARSIDKGATWRSVSLGNQLTISRIDTINTTYYAINQHARFISSDNGKTWASTTLEGAVDIRHRGDSLYILTYKSLLVVVLPLVKPPSVLLLLDSTSTYSNLTLTDHGSLHWIRNSKDVVNYDRNTQTISSQNGLEFSHCSSCSKVACLQNCGNTLFVGVLDLQRSTFGTAEENYLIMTSADYGASWKYFLPDRVGRNMWIDISNFKALSDSEVVALRKRYIRRDVPIIAPDTLRRSVSQSFLMFEYITLKHSLDETILNPADTIPERYAVASDQHMASFVHIDSNIIVGAGENHCIVRSTDNGKSWKYISYFPTIGTGAVDFYKRIGSDFMHIPDGGGAFYKTNNHGATILPQQYAFRPQFINSSLVLANYSEDGRGFVIIATGMEQDTNVFETHDYGETYRPKGVIPVLNVFARDSVSRDKYQLVDRDVKYILKTPSSYLIPGTPTYYDSLGRFSRHPYSVVLLLDSNYKVKDTVKVPVRRIRSIMVFGDTLYLIGMNLTDYSYKKKLSEVVYPKYAMYRSTNEGATWDSISVSFPFTNTYFKAGEYFNSVTYNFQPSCVFGRKLVYYIESSKLLVYSIDDNRFDTLALPFEQLSPENRSTFLVYNSSVTTAASNSTLMFAKSLEDRATLWDSLKIDDILPWDSTKILSGIRSSDINHGMIVTGEYKSNDIFANYKTHIAWFGDTLGTSTVHADGQDIYLWESPPYPLPTHGIVSTNVYWDYGFTIKDLNVDIYDIYGERLADQKMTENIQLTPVQDYAGVLAVDFTGMPKGVYIIRICVRQTSRIVPIVVN